MGASTVRRILACVLAIATAACVGEKTQPADTAGASPITTTPSSPPTEPAKASGAAAARPDTSSAAKPGSPASPPPVAGRPACARPVPVTYYARGGVPDRFIVTFGGMNGAPADAVIDTLARRHGFTPTHRYEGAFSGFSARLALATLEAIRCEPAVTRISQVVVGSPGTPPPAAPPPHDD